jgi:hypothetical protein
MTALHFIETLLGLAVIGVANMFIFKARWRWWIRFIIVLVVSCVGNLLILLFIGSFDSPWSIRFNIDWGAITALMMLIGWLLSRPDNEPKKKKVDT